VLAQTAALAGAHLPGAAAVTLLLPDGSLETLYGHELAAAGERAQYRHGQGPTLEACAGETLLHVPDLSAEARWGAFVRDARELGIAGVLACALGQVGSARAALSLYTTRAHAFGPDAAAHATLLAAHARLALAGAAQAESLRTALLSRQMIGEATGILMQRQRLDSRAAFALLVAASQRLNVKLRRVAEHVVLTGTDPAQITSADLPPEPARPGRRERSRAPTPPTAPPGLAITVGAAGDGPLLQVTGEIDLATNSRLQQALHTALQRARPGATLIVDLTRVGFCDVAGVRVILNAAYRAEQNGANLRIVPCPAFTRVIDLIGGQQALRLLPEHRRAVLGPRKR
jgi:anti-anti-sigma factor